MIDGDKYEVRFFLSLDEQDKYYSLKTNDELSGENKGEKFRLELILEIIVTA